ncbi:MAG: winged helix-turn-helix domain-containing protein [Armatimonadetes bacterium]|nr:winged helix-turn-helix domain-containing protein [Armatimonadota bacterium]
MEERREVEAAFEQLLTTLGREMAMVESECLHALEEHDLANLDRTRRLLDRLAGIKTGLMALQRGWRATKDDLGDRRRRYLGRLDPGTITHRSAYRVPILRALAQYGGRAEAEQALAKIEELMAGVLSGADYQPVPSRPQVPRWRNACHSARHDMMKEGLLDPGAGRGAWALTPAGADAARDLDLELTES